MDWKQDTGDYSWCATDAHGYFYRVQKVVAEDGTTLWATGWSERNGLRLGAHAWRTADDAKSHMNWIASADEPTSAISPPQHSTPEK